MHNSISVIFSSAMRRKRTICLSLLLICKLNVATKQSTPSSHKEKEFEDINQSAPLCLLTEPSPSRTSHSSLVYETITIACFKIEGGRGGTIISRQTQFTHPATNHSISMTPSLSEHNIIIICRIKTREKI